MQTFTLTCNLTSICPPFQHMPEMFTGLYGNRDTKTSIYYELINIKFNENT